MDWASYVTNTTVNVVNVHKITYINQNNVGAVTAVSRETFVNARPVGTATVRVNPQQLQAAEVQRGAAVAPVRQSIVGTTAPAAVKPPEAVMRRRVVVKETPPSYATRVLRATAAGVILATWARPSAATDGSTAPTAGPTTATRWKIYSTTPG